MATKKKAAKKSGGASSGAKALAAYRAATEALKAAGKELAKADLQFRRSAPVRKALENAVKASADIQKKVLAGPPTSLV